MTRYEVLKLAQEADYLANEQTDFDHYDEQAWKLLRDEIFASLIIKRIRARKK